MFIIKRPPTTPGEILEEEFIKPLGLTQKQLADHIGCDVKVINRIVNNKTSISAEMAVKLGSTFNQQFSVNIVQYLNKLDKVGFHASVTADNDHQVAPLSQPRSGKHRVFRSFEQLGCGVFDDNVNAMLVQTRHDGRQAVDDVGAALAADQAHRRELAFAGSCHSGTVHEALAARQRLQNWTVSIVFDAPNRRSGVLACRAP